MYRYPCVTSQGAAFSEDVSTELLQTGAKTHDLHKVSRLAVLKVATFTSCQPESSLQHLWVKGSLERGSGEAFTRTCETFPDDPNCFESWWSFWKLSFSPFQAFHNFFEKVCKEGVLVVPRRWPWSWSTPTSWINQSSLQLNLLKNLKINTWNKTFLFWFPAHFLYLLLFYSIYRFVICFFFYAYKFTISCVCGFVVLISGILPKWTSSSERRQWRRAKAAAIRSLPTTHFSFCSETKGESEQRANRKNQKATFGVHSG